MDKNKRWRVIALTTVLGGLVVTGAFLLPGNEPGDPGLTAAARRTLDEPSSRATIRGFGAPTVEDYHAPDRVRIVTDLDGPRSEIIELGSVTYTELECKSPTGASHTFIRNDRARSDEVRGRRTPVPSYGRAFLSLAVDGGDVTSTGTGARTMYTVVFPPRPHPSPSLVPLRAHFVVVGGRVRKAFVVVAEHLGKQRGVQTVNITYSRFGQVPQIEPPPASEVSRQRGFVCDFTGTAPSSLSGVRVGR